MSLHIRRVERARDFMALAPLWSKLANAGSQLSPFLSYDWFWCCWHGVWPRYQPEILIIEEAKTPVAIIPLMHWRERHYGLPLRCMGFLEYPHSPMADLLTIAEPRIVINALLNHLASRSDWDVVSLKNFSGSSPTLRALKSILPQLFPWHQVHTVASPYLTIGGEWQGFYDKQGQSFKETHLRMQADLEQAGDVRLEEYHTIDPESSSFQEALMLIRQSQHRKDMAVPMFVSRLPEFLSELTRRASKNGWLSLWLLRLNGHVIAVEYQLQADDIAQALWAASDPTLQRYSLENVLNVAIVQSLFERGVIHVYNMTTANLDDGYQWCTGKHETVHVKFYRSGLYPQLISRLETALSLEVGGY